MIKKAIYIGEHFYKESGTSMSPVYLEDGSRYDWGFLQVDLQVGHEVHIRPANDAEYGHYERKLRELKAKRAKSERYANQGES